MSRKHVNLAFGSLALGVLVLTSWYAWNYVFRPTLAFNGDPSITHCSVHGNLLVEGQVPWVEGGEPTAPEPGTEREAESKLFPFAHTSYRAGCVWDPKMADVRVQVRYCTTCRDVRAQWERDHPALVEKADASTR
jgi:hypothetical protein